MTTNRKKIDEAELPELGGHDDWVRLQGMREVLPTELNKIPAGKLYHVTVSGSREQPREETKYGVSGPVVVAYDLFRHDPKDAPFVFNKDHYFVMREGDDDEGFRYYLYGPYRKGEPDHWLKEIPESYSACELLMSSSIG